MSDDNFFGRYAPREPVDPMPVWWQLLDRNRFPSYRRGADFLGSVVDLAGEPLIRKGAVWCHAAEPDCPAYMVVQYIDKLDRYWAIYSLVNQAVMTPRKINRIFRKKVLQPLKEPL